MSRLLANPEVAAIAAEYEEWYASLPPQPSLLESLVESWDYAGIVNPPWFNETKNTPRCHVRHVRKGLHPFGGALGPADKTCGNCFHLWRVRYPKCALMKNTHGPATDLRQSWRSCQRFKERT